MYINIKDDDKIIEISVKDMGVGIKEDNIENLFEKYYRVPHHAVQFQGLGVGLYISNEIIKRHGGDFNVISELGKGSAFTFTLPASGK